MTVNQSRPATVPTAAPAHDARRYRRVLLAVLAPVPWLALAVGAALDPTNVRDDTSQAYEHMVAHLDRMALLQVFVPLFGLTLIPAIYAVLWVCRRRSPRMTAWVGTICLLGAAAGLLVPGPNMFVYVTAKNDLDTTATFTLVDHLMDQPWVAVVLICFFLGVILVGRMLLGWLMLRSGVGPKVLPIALIISAPLDVFGTSGLLFHNDNAVLSFVLSALGFAAASRALLRTADDEFDLPPIAGATVS
jgi:hypothetical protein